MLGVLDSAFPEMCASDPSICLAAEVIGRDAVFDDSEWSAHALLCILQR